MPRESDRKSEKNANGLGCSCLETGFMYRGNFSRTSQVL